MSLMKTNTGYTLRWNRTAWKFCFTQLFSSQARRVWNRTTN